MILDVGKAEAILPTTDQSATEHYRIGQHVKAFVLEVRRTTRGPLIYVSRTHKNFLRRLFELEVPEIHAGTVEIKAIAREAGSRSKVAVSSRQEGLDPVGATVGQRGGRVQAVVAELGGEKIDVIPWYEDPAVFVANALCPAQVVGVEIDEENRIATVTVPERMLSLAIGREGQNARLAAKLTGWRIDIRSDQAPARAPNDHGAGCRRRRRGRRRRSRSRSPAEPSSRGRGPGWRPRTPSRCRRAAEPSGAETGGSRAQAAAKPKAAASRGDRRASRDQPTVVATAKAHRDRPTKAKSRAAKAEAPTRHRRRWRRSRHGRARAARPPAAPASRAGPSAQARAGAHRAHARRAT